MNYIIINKEDGEQGWSNKDGWCYDGYDVFADCIKDEINLPMGGQWEEHPYEYNDVIRKGVQYD